MSTESLEPQSIGLGRSLSSSHYARAPGSRSNQRVSDESSYHSVASTSSGSTRPQSPKNSDADTKGLRPSRFSSEPFSNDGSLSTTTRSEVASLSSVAPPSLGATDALLTDSKTDASAPGDSAILTGHDTQQDNSTPRSPPRSPKSKPPSRSAQPPQPSSPHYDVLQFWPVPPPPPPSAVMSETLRNEALLPRVGLTVILPDYLRHHMPTSMQPSPLLPARRGIYDLSDDPVDQLLGHYAISKSTSPPPAFGTSRLSPAHRTEPAGKGGQRSARASIDVAGLRTRRSPSGTAPSREGDSADSDTHLPALPLAQLSAASALRARSPVTVTGVGKLLVSRDASYTGSPPSRHASAAQASLTEEPSSSHVSITHVRRHRPAQETVPAPSTSPERNAAKALPNGVPLSRLAASHTAPRSRPRRGRNSLRGPSEDDVMQQSICISSPKSRRLQVRADSAEDDSVPSPTSPLGGHTMAMTLSRLNAEPVLDDAFYTMVQSHFVTLADSHQQRLQMKLNASLPVILQSFGCTGAAFDRIKKGNGS